jgi:hypothetical protein
MENLEYILPEDLKMWANSAGRKFLEAEEKIKGLSTKNISASAYWDENSDVAIVTEEGKIYTYGKSQKTKSN